MKRSELIFAAVSVPVDYIMLILAGLAAYALRTSPLISQVRPVYFALNLPLQRYLGLVLVIGFIWLIIFALAGLYEIRRSNRAWEELSRIIIASSAGLVGIVFYIFIRQQFFDSRFIVLAAWFLAIIFVIMGRIWLRILQNYLISCYQIGMHNVLVVGGDGVSEEIIEEINNRPAYGYHLIKYLENIDLGEIKSELAKNQIDDIILANPDFPREDVVELIDFCEEKHINFKFVPNLFQTLTTNIDFDTLGAVPLIELRRTALNGWGQIIKRIMDMIGGFIGLIISSPIMFFLAIIIKLDSPGPIIYKNERVGYDGNIFNTYKFRSMKIEYCTGSSYDKTGQASRLEDELVAKQSLRQGPVFKVVNDPRRTKLGQFLEKTSLDELPQFLNVLIGNMSLVGPRPHMPKEVAKYEKWHKKVFNIKPGLTGLAQISGRSDINFDEEAKLDTYYIENWSLKLDFKILLKTPLVVVFGKHK